METYNNFFFVYSYVMLKLLEALVRFPIEQYICAKYRVISFLAPYKCEACLAPMTDDSQTHNKASEGGWKAVVIRDSLKWMTVEGQFNP